MNKRIWAGLTAVTLVAASLAAAFPALAATGPVVIGEETIDNTIYPTETETIPDAVAVPDTDYSQYPHLRPDGIDTPMDEAEIPVSEEAVATVGAESMVFAETADDGTWDPEHSPYDIAVPNVELSVNVSRDFSLAYAAENVTLYAPDLKTPLFALAKGDSVLVKDGNKKTLSRWTAVLVVDNGGDYLAYVQSSKLARKNKNTLRVRDVSKYSQYCVSVDADKSYKIYDKPSSDSTQIGTLRKATVLPVISVGASSPPCGCMAGWDISAMITSPSQRPTDHQTPIRLEKRNIHA